MTPSDRRVSSRPLDYETPIPRARRVVTIPRWLYAVHRELLENAHVISLVYGILLMSFGWAFKAIGFAFVVAPKRHRQAS